MTLLGVSSGYTACYFCQANIHTVRSINKYRRSREIDPIPERISVQHLIAGAMTTLAHDFKSDIIMLMSG